MPVPRPSDFITRGGPTTHENRYAVARRRDAHDRAGREGDRGRGLRVPPEGSVAGPAEPGLLRVLQLGEGPERRRSRATSAARAARPARPWDGRWRRARRRHGSGGRGDRRQRRQGSGRGCRRRRRARAPALHGRPAGAAGGDGQRLRPRLRRLHGRPRLHGPMMARRTDMNRATVLMGMLAVALGAIGCPATYQARSVKPSGFLGDYSQLRPGKEGEALLVYVRPGVEWTKYDKIWLEPVTVWGDVKGAFSSPSPRTRPRCWPTTWTPRSGTRSRKTTSWSTRRARERSGSASRSRRRRARRCRSTSCPPSFRRCARSLP